MPWLQVSVDVPGSDADALAERLSDAGASAVSVIAADAAAAVIEPDPAQTPMWEAVRLDALFALESDFSGLRSALGGRAGFAEIAFVEDQDWSNLWRQAVTVQHYAGRLAVVPRDHPADDLTGAVLRLDPGLAFGTGGHATTAMCLEALAGRELKNLSVADIGCGSGILSIAALVLGARSVLAVDHDPQALIATRENASFNDVFDGRFSVSDVLPSGEFVDHAAQHVDGAEDSSTDQREFAILVANILANPLIQLADCLSRLVERGGTIILSGILDVQLEAVLTAYPGFNFEAPARRDGWLCVEGTRRSG